MLYIASALPPSAVVASVAVPGFTSAAQTLLIARPDRIEVHDVAPSGLVERASLNVWGSVVSISPTSIQGSKPHLLVLLAPPSARLLVLAFEDGALRITSSMPLTPPTPTLRQAEFLSTVVVQDRVGVASVWTGVLSHIELGLDGEKTPKRRRSSASTAMGFKDPGDRAVVIKSVSTINIREHNLLSLAFVGPGMLVFLYLSSEEEIRLQLRTLNNGALVDAAKRVNVLNPSGGEEGQYEDMPDSCPAARHVVPLGERFAVIGDEYAVLYDYAPTSPRVNRSPRKVKEGPKDAKEGLRGKLHPVARVRQGLGTILSTATYGDALLLGDECGKLHAVLWDSPTAVALGTTSPASALVPLSGPHIFVASAAGDSQLIQLASPTRLELLERRTGLAPIKDFCVGEAGLVLACGSATANSLRVVRSGVGLEEVLQVKLDVGVGSVWNVGGKLLLSGDATILVDLAEDGQEVPLCDELAAAEVLAAGDVGGLVTVTSTGVVLWQDVGAGTKRAEWKGQPVVAQVKADRVVLATKDGVTLLRLGDGLQELSAFELQVVSAVAVNDDVVAAATWTGDIVVNGQTLHEDAYAVSLLFSSPTQLLAGLSDGSLVTYDLTTRARKISKLGTRPLRLCPVQWAGDERVVAVALSDGMSVVFETNGRIDFSSASLRDVQAAVQLDHAGQALALLTPEGVTVARVNSLKKLSVQTLDTGERSATRLAYVPGAGLVTGSVERHVDQGEITQRGMLELRDALTLQLRTEMPLLLREVVTALKPLTVGTRSLLAVGTAIFRSDEDYEDALFDGSRVAAHEGRVMLVVPGDLDVVALLKTVGPVHDLEVVRGFLAVAAASRVSIHRMEGLIEIGSFASTFIAQHLHMGEKLVVGDGMRSVTVLDVDEAGQVVGDVRDMATHSVRAMAGIKDNGPGVVISDGHANLLTFRLSKGIDTAASFGLHEPVVRFVPGSLAPPASASENIAPELLFATPDGRLGVLGELTLSAGVVLGELQRNMDHYVPGPGETWAGWRRGGSGVLRRDTAGFVDGDFVQTMRDMGVDEADKVIRGGGAHERVHVQRGAGAGAGGARGVAGREEVLAVLEAVAGVH